MYIAFLEQTVLSCVQRLGGPSDWALPYWDYSGLDPKSLKLPAAFFATNLPDGSPNPLRVAARARGNAGEDVGTNNTVALGCLKISPFEGSGISGAFGGPVGLNHSPTRTRTAGALEVAPHGSMHIAVGGWMARFNTAALDPIFWLHHCNIDRLWEVWLRRNKTFINPTKSDWLTRESFVFHDAAGHVVVIKAAQVLDTKAAPLFYRYEDTSDPLAIPAAPAILPQLTKKVTMLDAIPEMIGASSGPIALSGKTEVAGFPLTAPQGPAADPALARADAPRPRMFLMIENITGSGNLSSYSVYVNVPNGEDPVAHDELFAGVMAMFGVVEASSDDSDHSDGSGMTYTFDVTDLVATLQAADAWNSERVQLTFVPEFTFPESDAQNDWTEGSAQIGRVSWHIAA